MYDTIFHSYFMLDAVWIPGMEHACICIGFLKPTLHPPHGRDRVSGLCGIYISMEQEINPDLRSIKRYDSLLLGVGNSTQLNPRISRI